MTARPIYCILLVLNSRSPFCTLYRFDAVSRLADSLFVSVHVRFLHEFSRQYFFQLMVGWNKRVDVMEKVVAILRSALAGHRSYSACSAHLNELSKRVKADCVPFVPSPRLSVDSL